MQISPSQRYISEKSSFSPPFIDKFILNSRLSHPYPQNLLIPRSFSSPRKPHRPFLTLNQSYFQEKGDVLIVALCKKLLVGHLSRSNVEKILNFLM